MKKLLLGLGTSLLSVLPIVAISSCTVDSTNYEQQELIEQANLLCDKPTILATETASQALLNITNDTLNNYYAHVEMEPGISYSFVSGKIHSVSNTTLDITLSVEGPIGTTPVTKIIQLTDFRELTMQEKLEEQANLLIDKQTLFPHGLETTQEAKKRIIDQATLNEYYSPMLLSEGIFYSFISSSISMNSPTTLNIIVKVEGQEGTKPIEKEIKLTGFTSAQEKLFTQAQLLIDQQVLDGKETQTPREAQAAMTAENFNEYYKPIDLSPGYSYSFISSALDPTNTTTLNVTLLVIGESGTSPITWTVKLMNFLSPDSQLQEQAKLLTDKPVLDGKETETPREAQAAMTAENFNEYYKPIDLSPGYSYSFISSALDPTNPTSLNVTLTVTGEEGTTPITKTIQITGFTDPQVKLQEQANRLFGGMVLDGKETQTPREAQVYMTAENFNEYYKPIDLLSPGYSYTFISSALDSSIKTSLNVTLTVTGEEGTNPITKTIQIGGFTDPQDKLDAQARLLTDKPVLDVKKSETPRQAQAAMTADNFNGYYARPNNLLPGYSYTFISSEPHSSIKTSLNVTLKVTGEVGTNPIDKTIQITGFTDPQVKLKEQAKLLTNKPVLDGKKSETPREAQVDMTANNNFDEYYARPNNLLPGYSYNFISSEPHPSIKTSLNVTLIVTGEEGTIPVTKTIQITGFTDPQVKLQEQADRLVSSETIKPDMTVSQVLDVIDKSNYGEYYAPIEMSLGISYEFVKAIKKDETSITITFLVTGEEGTTPVPKNVDVTNFRLPTPLENESEKLQISLVAKTPSMKISEAITEINRASSFDERIVAINKIVDGFPELTQEFTYNIISGEVDPSDSQTLMIKFSIKTTGELVEELQPILRITNLANSTDLELEASWFSASRRGKNSETTAPITVLTAINSAKTNDEKITIINSYSSTPLPTPSAGFSITIGEAVANQLVPSTIDITITISKNSINKVVTYSITDLVGSEPGIPKTS